MSVKCTIFTKITPAFNNAGVVATWLEPRFLHICDVF